MPTVDRTVSVLGLGLMGSALARALLANGLEVTVWNRSPEKAAEFEGLAPVANSVLEACAASSVIVVCLLIMRREVR
jgi:3-hydroxyisobutyrate dehydrogenase-like beta-hydroxyacid dehydrogenase